MHAGADEFGRDLLAQGLCVSRLLALTLVSKRLRKSRCWLHRSLTLATCGRNDLFICGRQGLYLRSAQLKLNGLPFCLLTPVCWRAAQVMKKKAKPAKGKPAGGPPKMLTKSEPCASFFNFFKPPQEPEDDAEIDEEEMEDLRAALEEDYELGCACWRVSWGFGRV